MIQLNNGYRISASENKSYQLEIVGTYETGKNAGEEKVNTIGYYGSIESALRAYLSRLIHDRVRDEDLRIEELIYAVEQIQSEIRELMGGV